LLKKGAKTLGRGTIDPVSSLISISTVWIRRCNRGQYCIGSNTRVIISPSLPSTGTILNNSTCSSPKEKAIRYLREDDIKEDIDLAVSLEDFLKQPCLCWKREQRP
jgi:hypothetical protein